MPDPASVSLPDNACIASASGVALRCMGGFEVLGSLQRVDIEAGGHVHCGGDLVGGSVVCGGELRCEGLGGAAARTHVWVGAPPRDARELVEEAWLQDAAYAREMEAHPRGDDPRRGEIVAKRQAIGWRLEKLAAASSGGSLEVLGRLEAGVSLRLGLRRERFTFLRPVAGPLRIAASPEGEPLLTQPSGITRLEGARGFVRV